jgi:hypothetical protein
VPRRRADVERRFPIEAPTHQWKSPGKAISDPELLHHQPSPQTEGFLERRELDLIHLVACVDRACEWAFVRPDSERIVDQVRCTQATGDAESLNPSSRRQGSVSTEAP